MPGQIYSGHDMPFTYAQVDPFQRMASRAQPGHGVIRAPGYRDLLGNRYNNAFPTVNALMGRGPRSAGFRARVADQMISQPTYLGRTPYRLAGGAARRLGAGLRTGISGLGIDVAITAADMLAQGMTHSVRWAAKTGREEDYVGGFVFGSTKAAGAGIAGTAGFIAGAAVGSLILPGVGTFVGGAIGSIAGYTIGGTAIGDYAYERGKMFSGIAASAIAKDKIEFGHRFQDSEAAFTMRQLAVQEMAGSLLNARQYLGNEAYFMHR